MKAPVRRKEAYLQLYSLSRISERGWQKLIEDEFFEKYIQNGSFVNSSLVMFHTSHYMQKGDGSFRNAELLSPILFLILQALGKELADYYYDGRPSCFNTYYAGNLRESAFFYKAEYDKFFKEINNDIDSYHYYIKTDISSFFSSIDLNRLLSKIDERINNEDNVFSPAQLNIIKEFLSYCGKGGFPLVESSAASSFLATVVYLEDVDCKLAEYIQSELKCFDRVRFIRYVDDLYILLRCKDGCSYSEIHEASIDIRNKYSSLLKTEGLSLNAKKYQFRKPNQVCEDLKKSLYDEYYEEAATTIEEFYPDALISFLTAIEDRLLEDCIDWDQYINLIMDHFSRDDIEFTPEEVFNHFVYGSTSINNADEVAEVLARIALRDISIIGLDAKRLLTLLIKVQSNSAVRKVLNRLFKRHSEGKWNSYDTTVSIAYLLHSGFKHIDLLDVLKAETPELYLYYYRYCRKTAFAYKNEATLLRCKAIKDDWITNYLFLLYLARKDNNNRFEAYAFYKSFFDRITADVAFMLKRDLSKKPAYNNYYKEKPLIAFYGEIPNADSILKKAHNLRNENPINHASSEVVKHSGKMKELESCAMELEKLLDQYLELHKDEF